MRKRYGISMATAGAAFFLCLALFACLAPAALAASSGKTASNKYQVLFLSSYSMNDAIVSEEIAGLSEALPADSCDINYEFMDTRRYNSDYDLSIFYRYLKNKFYRSVYCDCIIAGDDAALTFLLQRSDLSDGTPIIFLGIQDQELVKRAQEEQEVVGVTESYDYEGTLDAVADMLPETTDVYYVLDGSDVGQIDKTLVDVVAAEHPEYAWHMLNLSEMGSDELITELSTVNNGSVVLLGELYLEQDGTVNSFSYLAQRIASICPAPVFTMPIDVTGDGVLGSVVYDSQTAARYAGEMALAIMGGTSPENILTYSSVPSIATFDKNVLNRFGIEQSSVPDGATIINAEPTFWEKNWRVIIAVLAVIAALVLVIMLLSFRNRRQHRLLKTDEEIFRQTALAGSDFVAVLTADDGMIALRSGIWGEKDDEIPEALPHISFVALVNALARRYVSEADRSDFSEAMELERVIAELEHKPEYVVSFNFNVAGSRRRKQFNFAWLDHASRLILVFRTDITRSLEEEQRRNQQLQDSFDEAERANEAKSEFVSRISHDIRTPIGAILNLTDFAKADANDPARLDDDLEKIGTSGRLLLSLINDVLDISKIESDKIELTPEPYAFDDFVSEMRNIIDPMCSEKGLIYTIDSSNVDAQVLLIDRVRLNQIALNILSNAVKYTPSGGSLRFTASDRTCGNDEGIITFEVADTGIGMTEKFQKVMFENFTQDSDNPFRPREAIGTGLGLSIVKRLVDHMGGTIDVVSEVGKGTVVTVGLPARISEQGLVSSAKGKKPLSTRQLSGKVLLAEDNAINAQIAMRIFEEIGMSVDLAEDGSREVELFDKSAEGEYLAVFTDIQMPVMNGYEATREIRELSRPDAATVPIVAMTADAFSDAMAKATESGMTEFITKPLKVEEIRTILGSIVMRRRD